MKLFSTALAIITMMAIYSCQPKGDPCPECPEIPAKNSNGIFALTPNTTITKDTFDVWVARWDANYRNYMANDSMHYFDMPLVDLTTIISNTNVNGSRIYMGMAYDNTGTMRPHTIIVGTVNGIADFSAIMDYSSICPRHCPQ